LKIVTIVQARLASTRLPWKVLAKITTEHSLLSFIRSRIEDANHDSIWLATTKNEEDEELVDLAQSWGWHAHRGSEIDVLSRFTSICLLEKPDWIIRVTADNPLTHKAGLNLLINQASHAQKRINYISDFLKRQTPQGSFPEIVRMDRLLSLSNLTLAKHHKVHVTSAIVESGHGVESLQLNQDFPVRPKWRWTVDELSDLQFIKSLIESYGPGIIDKGYREIVEHIDKNLWLVDINCNIRTKSVEEG